MSEVLTNVKASFHNTFIVLVFSALVTFFSTFFVSNKKYLTILHLETMICVVASIFYFVFLQKVAAPGTVDWQSLTQIRYADWFFTTPMMLVSLAIFFAINSNSVAKISTLSVVVVLNYIMLGMGYLGETKEFPHFWAMIIGFVPFFIMFYILHESFVKNVAVNRWLFGIYLVLWSLYGIVYMLPEEQKNLMTNWLDLVTKGVVGVGIAAYLLMNK
jgi:bacteriorhodopsin